MVREIRRVHTDPLQHAVDDLLLAGQEEPPRPGLPLFRVFLQARRDVGQGIDGDGDQPHLPVEPVAQLHLQIGEDSAKDGADEAARGEEGVDHHDPVADHVPREPHLPPVLVQQGDVVQPDGDRPGRYPLRGLAPLRILRPRDRRGRRQRRRQRQRGHGPRGNGGSPSPMHHRIFPRTTGSFPLRTSPGHRGFGKGPFLTAAPATPIPSRAGPCPDPPERSPRPGRPCGGSRCRSAGG